MKFKLLMMLTLVVPFVVCDVALSGTFSAAMTDDVYTGNVPNGIPTPNMSKTTNSNGGPYDLYNAVNRLYGSATFQNNAGLDELYNSGFNDDIWVMTEGHALVRQVGGTAKNSTKMGFFEYDANGQPVKVKQLFSNGEIFKWSGAGTNAAPLPANDFSSSIGRNIGWYVESTDWRTGVATTFYSDPRFNVDGYDHFITYGLNGSAITGKYVKLPYLPLASARILSPTAYLIGFEDRLFNAYNSPTCGDDDYNDLLFLAEYVDPIPAGGVALARASAAPTAVPEPATVTLVAAGLAGLFLYNRRSRR